MTIIVVLNSLLIGYLLIKKLLNQKQTNNTSRNSDMRNKFRKIRDSIRFRKNRFNTRESLRNARNSIRSRSRELRDSIRSRRSSIKEKIKDKVPISPELTKKLEQFKSSSFISPNYVTTGTNTNTHWQPPLYSLKIYPALPQYN